MSDQQDIDQVASALRLAGAMRQADSRRLVSGQPALSRDRVATQLREANERQYLHKQQESLLETQRLVRDQVAATSRLADLVERLVRQRTRRPVHKVKDSEKKRLEPIGGFTRPAPGAGGKGSDYTFWDSLLANFLANAFTKGGLLGRIAGGLASALGLKKLGSLLGGLVTKAKGQAGGLLGGAAKAAKGAVAKIQQAPKAVGAAIGRAATTPLTVAQKAATGAVKAADGIVSGAKAATGAVSGAAKGLVGKIQHLPKLPFGLGLLVAGADLAHNEATKQGEERRVGRWRVAGEQGGALAGGLAGAKAGAALGTLVAPGLGTAVGAGLGGLLGAIGGGELGSKLATAFATSPMSAAQGPSHMAGGQKGAKEAPRPLNPELSSKELEEVAANTRPLANGGLADAIKQALWPLTTALTSALSWFKKGATEQSTVFTQPTGGGEYHGAGASGQWAAPVSRSSGYVEQNGGASGVVAGSFADAVGRVEAGSRGYNAYNRGKVGQGREHIDLTNMTLAEIRRHQRKGLKDPTRLGAVGKYQIIGGTLQEAIDKLGLDPNAKFTPELQDRIFTQFLTTAKKGKNTGAIDEFLTGRSQDLGKAVNATANVWAAILRTDGKGQHDGIAGNKGILDIKPYLLNTRELYKQNLAAGADHHTALDRAKLGQRVAAPQPKPAQAKAQPVASGGASGSWEPNTGGASGSWEAPTHQAVPRPQQVQTVTTRSMRHDKPQATVKAQQPTQQPTTQDPALLEELKATRQDLNRVLNQLTQGGNRELPSLANTPGWPQDPMLGLVLNGTF